MRDPLNWGSQGRLQLTPLSWGSQGRTGVTVVVDEKTRQHWRFYDSEYDDPNIARDDEDVFTVILAFLEINN